MTTNETKAPRGSVKAFKAHLNAISANSAKHVHGRFHQISRPYGDYLYAQDREKFNVDMAQWLVGSFE